MKTIADTQKELKELLPEGVDVALKGIKAALAEGTDKYNDLLLIEGQYQDTSRQLLQGIIGNEVAQIAFNKIRKDLLDFIDSLKENHLATAEKMGVDGKPDIYNGEVLYRIPSQMKVQEEVKCLVRLAFDRKVILEDIEKQEGDVLKDIRISEVMGVELLDPAGKAFEIRTLYDTVQFVEKDLYTEWVFFVKPIMEGMHNLVLKISIIEIKNGVERKRNVVLEEKVQIVSEATEQTGIAEERRAAALALATAQDQSGGGGADVPAPAPRGGAEAPRPSGRGSMIKKMSTIASALAVLLVATWAMMGRFGPGGGEPGDVVITEDQKMWDNVRSNPSPSDVVSFIDEYPASQFRDEARHVLDSLENVAWNSALASRDPDKMKDFMDQFPASIHTEAAAMAIEEWEEATVNTGEPEQPNAPRPAVPETETGGGTDRGETPSGNEEEGNNQSGTNNNPVDSNIVDPEPEPEEEPVDPDPNEPISMQKASRLPIFPDCRNDNNKWKERACTAKGIGNFIKKNLKYPSEARRKDIEGTITVEFIVEKDGHVTDVESQNDIGGGCAEEAIRLVQKLPQFEPGLNRLGEPARIRYILPIRFKLR